MKKTHIIIGASAAGIGVLNQLRSLDPESTIICIEKNTDWPYNTCFLADYLAGTKEHAQLLLKSHDFFEKNNIQLILGKEVVAIDRINKTISLSDGQLVTYDTLFLGIGVRARTLPQFAHCQGVFSFHTYSDVAAIKEYISQNKIAHAVVIGAGLSGLEVADSLCKNNISVTIVEQSVHVLPHHVDMQGSHVIEQNALSHNATIMVNSSVADIKTDGHRLVGVCLAQGQEIAAQLLIVAIGAIPNNELLKQAGLTLEQGALVVNEYLQTNDSAIFAGGDIVQVTERVTMRTIKNGTWPDAMHQGLIAAHGMAGLQKSYPGAINIVSSAFFGLHFFSCGLVASVGHMYTIKIIKGADFYHKFLLDSDGVLKGFLLVGNTQRAAEYRKYYLAQVPAPLF